MQILIILYNTVFIAFFLLVAPLWLLSVFFTEKWSSIFFRRIWLVQPENVEQLKGSLWIHALSVGEVFSAVPFVESIKKGLKTPLLLTVSTMSGFKTASDIFRNHDDIHVCYFPVDFIFSVKRALQVIQPGMIVIIENDLWPNFIRFAKSAGIPLIWVNARVSDRSFPRFFFVKNIVSVFFDSFDLVMAQTSLDKQRLERLGIPAEKIIRTGNIKYDRNYTSCVSETAIKSDVLYVEDSRPVFVAGSTHHGEEKILCSVYERLIKKTPDMFFVIAPRDPSRASDVMKIFEARGIDALFLSDLKNGHKSQVAVVDSLGKLLELYSVSDIAFIGGSLFPYGGHNPLEPASFAKPVFFGPYMNDFREISNRLVNDGGAVMVDSADDFYEKLNLFFSDGTLKKDTGQRAFVSAGREKGAVSLSCSLVKKKYPAAWR